MREKKQSETEEPVRLPTSDETWDIMREGKQSETEEPVRRLVTTTEPEI
jgi:hypothetical protein